MVQVKAKKKITKAITVAQLQQLLMSTKINGGTFIYVMTYTREHKLKNSRTSFLSGVKKLIGTVGHAYAHHQYENQRKKVEPNYVSKPRTWGTRLKDVPLVEYKGKYYLELFFDNKRVKTFLFGYFLNGKKVPNEIVLPQLREQKYEPVIYRNFALDSIREIKINGQGYKIV